jgi:hypothetical protein
VKDSVVRTALAAARNVETGIGLGEDEDRAEILATLAPHLAGPVLQEALAVVGEMRIGMERAKALTAIAGQMTASEKESALLNELNQISAATSSPWQQAAPENEEERNYRPWFFSRLRVGALVALAPQLSGSLLAEALLLARQIHGKAAKAKAAALTALARQMTGDEKEAVIREALSAARDIDFPEARVRDPEAKALALAAVARELGEPEKASALTDALAAAKQCEGDEPLMEALISISPQLSGPLLSTALVAAMGIKDEGRQVRAVEAIAKSARDGDKILPEIRRHIVEYLWSTISRKDRRIAYEFCRGICHPPLVSPHMVEETAKHIGDIALRWTWT